jgi:hypothetical protein
MGCWSLTILSRHTGLKTARRIVIKSVASERLLISKVIGRARGLGIGRDKY